MLLERCERDVGIGGVVAGVGVLRACTSRLQDLDRVRISAVHRGTGRRDETVGRFDVEREHDALAGVERDGGMGAESLLRVAHRRLALAGPGRGPGSVRWLDGLAIEQCISDLDRAIEDAWSRIRDRDRERGRLTGGRHLARVGRLADREIGFLADGWGKRRRLRAAHGRRKANAWRAIERKGGCERGRGRTLIVAREGVDQRSARRLDDQSGVRDLALGHGRDGNLDGHVNFRGFHVRKIGVVAAALVEVREQRGTIARPTGRRLEFDLGARRRAERKGVHELDLARVRLAEVLHFDFEQAGPVAACDGADLAGARLLELQVAHDRKNRARRGLARQDHRGLCLVVGRISIEVRAAGCCNDLDLVRRLASEIRNKRLWHAENHAERAGLVGQQADGFMLAAIGRGGRERPLGRGPECGGRAGGDDLVDLDRTIVQAGPRVAHDDEVIALEGTRLVATHGIQRQLLDLEIGLHAGGRRAVRCVDGRRRHVEVVGGIRITEPQRPVDARHVVEMADGRWYREIDIHVEIEAVARQQDRRSERAMLFGGRDRDAEPGRRICNRHHRTGRRRRQFVIDDHGADEGGIANVGHAHNVIAQRTQSAGGTCAGKGSLLESQIGAKAGRRSAPRRWRRRRHRDRRPIRQRRIGPVLGFGIAGLPDLDIAGVAMPGGRIEAAVEVEKMGRGWRFVVRPKQRSRAALDAVDVRRTCQRDCRIECGPIAQVVARGPHECIAGPAPHGAGLIVTVAKCQTARRVAVIRRQANCELAGDRRPNSGRCGIVGQFAPVAEYDRLFRLGKNRIVIASRHGTALGDVHVIGLVEDDIGDGVVGRRARDVDFAARVAAEGPVQTN